MNVARHARVVLWLLILALIAVPRIAQAQPTQDIRLPVPFYSQFDSRWANVLIGAGQDVKMSQMGCVLTSVAMIAAYNRLSGRFIVPGMDFSLAATPDYVHLILRDHHGYLRGAPKTASFDLTNGLAGAFVDPAGSVIGLRLFTYGWPDGKGIVDANLSTRPAILVLQNGNDFHAVVAVGWDTATSSYLILNPAWHGTAALAMPMREEFGAKWESLIVQVADAQGVIAGISSPLFLVSTHSPVETLVTDPQGRKTGFDATAQARVTEVPGSSYVIDPVWTDPSGQLPPRSPGRFAEIESPIPGRYQVQMIGTGDGPFTLDVRAYDTQGQMSLDRTIEGTITTGQVLTFQVEYAAAGPAQFTETSNFTPVADAGGNRLATTGALVNLDGGRSFDVDGTIATYAWDFGDGTSATGQLASHSYASLGTYAATLTVTDNEGATAHDTAVVSVFAATSSDGRTERISVSTAGAEAISQFGSFSPSISADGRFVAFQSWANNLAPGDVRDFFDVFVRDRQNSTTQLASPSACVYGSRHPSISADGRFIAFECEVDSNGSGIYRILVRDQLTGAFDEVDVSTAGAPAECSRPGCGSFAPAISADGRFVAFYSEASNLVPDDTNGGPDVFVRDRLTGVTERVSVTNAGAQLADGVSSQASSQRVSISGDGRIVAFESTAGDVVPGFFYGQQRVIVRDRQMATTDDVSVALPNSGFTSGGDRPSVSADGRFVAFESGVDNLVVGDTNGSYDVFVRDRQAGATERVSLTGAGAQAACGSLAICARDPIISGDGRFVLFRSAFPGFVGDDANNQEDLFLHDRQTGATELVSLSTGSGQGNGASGQGDGALSADARFVAFVSIATNLVPNDANGVVDAFVRDRARSSANPVAAPSGPYLGWASPDASAAFVSFHAGGSLSPVGLPLTARWNFGDGTAPTVTDALTPTAHAYALPGTYTVTLVVADGSRSSAPVTTTADVMPALQPKRMAIAPVCGLPGDTVAMLIENQSLVSPLGGWDLGARALPPVQSVGPVHSVRLAFGGPTEADLSDTQAPIDSVSVTSALSFSTRFRFTVRPSWGSGTYSISAPDEALPGAEFTVSCPRLPNEPPIADVGGPYAGVAGAAVTFDGTRSADPEGSALTYRWLFEDGSTESGPRPSHVFAAPGTYLALLVVNDGTLDSPVSVWGGSYTTVVIAAAPPPFDTTPPVITSVVSGTPGTNGWYVSETSVSWSVADPDSPIVSKTGCDTVVATAEAAATFTCQATSAGGAASTSTTIKIDRTAPILSFASPSPAPNAAGWNRTDVAFGFSTADNLSGVALTSLPSPAIITGAGAGLRRSVTATDLAGNIATFASPPVRIDRTPPTITGSPAPAPNANGWNNIPVTVSFICTDALSGLAPGGLSAPVMLSANGANQSATGTCTDLAGNSASVTVQPINIDLIAPALTAPPNQIVQQTSAAGAAVTYPQPTIVETGSGSASPSCLPASGSVFPVGQTRVNCTATDGAGNVGSAIFTVTVQQSSLAPDGSMYGVGFIDQAGKHNHFIFRAAQLRAQDYGHLEFWVNDARHCGADDDYDHGPNFSGANDRDYGRDHHDPSNHFESTSISGVIFSDDPRFLPDRVARPTVDTVRLAGTGRWNGRSGYSFEAIATDRGEPGRHRDTFSLIIKDPRGNVVASVSGVLDSGNIQSLRLGR